METISLYVMSPIAWCGGSGGIWLVSTAGGCAWRAQASSKSEVLDIDVHLAKHSRFHVIEQMAVIGPPADCVGRDEIAESLRRLHVDRVLANEHSGVRPLYLAPHAVQMNGVIH